MTRAAYVAAGAGLALVALLGLLLSLLIWVGVPLLGLVLIFPALGLTGPALYGVSILATVVWWILLALLGRLNRR